MADQANDLRQLALRSARPDAAGRKGPALVVLGAGKGGVGTTTLAVNLAVALAQQRRRTMLIDADPHGGHASVLCGLQERYTLADVLCGRKRIPEVLQAGPCEVQILPGIWGLEKLCDDPPSATERLLDQLQGLEALVDLVVLDAGNSPSRMVQRLWQAADIILTVTSVETTSILDTYAAIKALAEGSEIEELYSLVNLVPSAAAAAEVHRRLAQVCQRFVKLDLKYCGHVPADPGVASSGCSRNAFMVAAPDCAAAQHMRRLAGWLATTAVHKRSAAVPAAAKHHHDLPACCDVNA